MAGYSFTFSGVVELWGVPPATAQGTARSSGEGTRTVLAVPKVALPSIFVASLLLHMRTLPILWRTQLLYAHIRTWY
jgi:hypothetical protein